MEEPETHTPITGAKSLQGHWGVGLLITGALVVFVLLLFADRTLLTTATTDSVPGKPEGSEGLTGLPPYPSGPEGQVLRGLAQQHAQQPADTEVVRRLISAAQNAERPDIVAVWTDTLAQLQPIPIYLREAGFAYHEALTLPPVSSDESLRGRFARRGFELLDRYSAAHPQDLDAQLVKGLLYVESGDPAIVMEGVRQLRDLAESHPDYFPAQLRLGIFSYQTGQYEKAIPRFRAVLKQQSRHAEASLYLGLSLAGQDQLTEARTHLLIAAQSSDPSLASAARDALMRLQKP